MKSKQHGQNVTRYYWGKDYLNIEMVTIFIDNKVRNCFTIYLFVVFKDLKGTTDPFCNFSSWQFQLTHAYNLRDHALVLQESLDKLKILYESDMDLFGNILQFLLSLRNLPTKDQNKLVSVFQFLVLVYFEIFYRISLHYLQ